MWAGHEDEGAGEGTAVRGAAGTETPTWEMGRCGEQHEVLIGWGQQLMGDHGWERVRGAVLPLQRLAERGRR